MFLSDQLALDLADACPDSIGGVILHALAGDSFAEEILSDWCQENEEKIVHPFQEGQSYFICTVTLYYVGKVTKTSLGWLELDEASWVHWTGRLSVLLGEKKFKSSKFGQRKPRTEYCGKVIIPTSSIVSVYPWDAPIPKENVE